MLEVMRAICARYYVTRVSIDEDAGDGENKAQNIDTRAFLLKKTWSYEDHKYR